MSSKIPVYDETLKITYPSVAIAAAILNINDRTLCRNLQRTGRHITESGHYLRIAKTDGCEKRINRKCLFLGKCWTAVYDFGEHVEFRYKLIRKCDGNLEVEYARSPEIKFLESV